MARSTKRKDELEELNEESLRMEQDTVETRHFSLEDDDTEVMELATPAAAASAASTTKRSSATATSDFTRL